MESTNQNDIRLGSHYRFYPDKKLGSGAFGDIYYGINTKTNQDIAVKVESHKVKNKQLHCEAKILKFLQGGVGIPKIHNFYESIEHDYMIIDLLGLSIESLFNNCSRKFSLKTILMLGEQMLSRIEFLHSRNLIHRDVKPDNFLIGLGKNKHNVYIIDFGLAKRFRDPKTGAHIPYKDGKSLTGTARYSSVFTHFGIEQSRRDDLESLGYCMVYLLRGELPWQGMKAKNKKEKYDKIMEKKLATNLEDLCLKNEELICFLQYTKSIQFEEKPSYQYLKSLLLNLFEKNKLEYDFLYDWYYLEGEQDNIRDKSEIE